MAKTLRDITGTNASKVVKLNHKDMYQWNSPDGLKFVDDKHPVDKHEDRVGNGDDVYKGKTKEAAYKKQSDGVYEEVEELDEISKEKLTSYVDKATKDIEAHRASGDNNSEKYLKRFTNRVLAKHKIRGDVNARIHHTDLEKSNAELRNRANKSARKLNKEETDANITNQKLGAGEKKTALLSFIECNCSECNNTAKGMKCEVHGMDECPGYSDKKGRKLLTDKKKAWEGIEIGKALRVGNQFTDTHLAKEKRNPANLGKPADLLHRANKTIGKLKGSTFMVKKLTEEQLHELSMKVLSSYIKKATNEMGKIAKKDPENRTFKDTDKYYDRAKGVDKAKDKLNEVAPPNPKIEKWIKDNKERFVKEYGSKKGKEVLYAKAWKMHNEDVGTP